jgi:sugar-specific transcriptional regulator TrmB
VYVVVLTTTLIYMLGVRVIMELGLLEELGLSSTEAKVYIALIHLGSAHAGELTKKAGVNRSNVYDAVERLIAKGLVSFVISDKKKLFSPANPQRLKEILVAKEKKLDSSLALLEKEFNSTRNQEDATVFRGKDGVKEVFEDVLREGKTLYAYGAESKFSDLFPIYQKQWIQRRKESGIGIKMIFNERVRSRHKEDLGLIEVKYLPEHYQFPSITLVYGDKTAIISWTDPIFVFSIKSKEVAKSNMNFFKILWDTAKK